MSPKRCNKNVGLPERQEMGRLFGMSDVSLCGRKALRCWSTWVHHKAWTHTEGVGCHLKSHHEGSCEAPVSCTRSFDFSVIVLAAHTCSSWFCICRRYTRYGSVSAEYSHCNQECSMHEMDLYLEFTSAIPLQRRWRLPLPGHTCNAELVSETFFWSFLLHLFELILNVSGCSYQQIGWIRCLFQPSLCLHMVLLSLFWSFRNFWMSPYACEI